ncbi:uncharacterized protein C6orf118-like [Ptychodera flava]|uniref:uncharacterized protein C6orf118-like n=1 Tax=Ptychodera flava TaxID=63121 RepID=UPI00396A1A5C
MTERIPVHEQRLGQLLDSVLHEHSKDIKAYSSGHLNHNKLYKHPTKASHVTWESAKKSVPVMNQPSKIPKPPKDTQTVNNMTSAMYNFSMGTSGSLPLPPVESRTKRQGSPSPRSTGSPSPLTAPPPPPSPRLMKRAQEDMKDLRASSSLSYKSDNIYIEELNLPEVMLPALGMRTQPKSVKKVEPGPLSQDSKSHAFQKQRFFQTHLGEVTKKDQYNKFQDFENHVLRKPDANEQNVLTGKKAVEHLEQKLQQLLMTLDEVHRSGAPNFHRLQLFGGIFEDLIEDTPIFGDILKRIKHEYDLYMGSLLDSQSAQSSQVLYQQVQNLTTSGTAAAKDVVEERQRVKDLEMDAKQLLNKNESLRNELTQEKIALANDPPPDNKPKKTITRYHDDKPKDVTEQIAELHYAILEQAEILQELREELKENYVPNSVCQHLEQCVKETEVEVQRVLSTNDYLERTIEQLENELERLLDKSGAEESDKRLLLKKLNLLSDSATETEVSDSTSVTESARDGQ